MLHIFDEILSFGEWFKNGCNISALFYAVANYVFPFGFIFYIAKQLLQIMIDMGNGKRGGK